MVERQFLPKDWIMEQWDAGYYITAIAGSSDASSLVVMSKGARFSQQSYKVSEALPYEWIRKKWREVRRRTPAASAVSPTCVLMEGKRPQARVLHALSARSRVDLFSLPLLPVALQQPAATGLVLACAIRLAAAMSSERSSPAGLRRPSWLHLQPPAEVQGLAATASVARVHSIWRVCVRQRCPGSALQQALRQALKAAARRASTSRAWRLRARAAAAAGAGNGRSS